MEITVSRTTNVLFPVERVQVREIANLVKEAIQSADKNFGDHEAIEWASGFNFPPGLGTRDANKLFEFNGNLADVTRERHTFMLKQGRLCKESTQRTVDPSDPDYALLMSLVDGVPKVTADAFVPNAGLIFILPTTVVLAIPGVHFSSTHGAKKQGKKKGRPIGDASSSESGCALNNDEVKLKVDAMWGTIGHPTVETLVRMISRVADRASVGWEREVLWKIDLKGAVFPLFIRPKDVRLLCFELTDGLTMMYPTVMFGHTEMPCDKSPSAYYK